MQDQRLRARLAALADEVPAQTVVPDGLVSRARRRSSMLVVATVACAALLVVATFAGVRALIRAEPPRPAIPVPTPTPAGPTDDAITIIPRGRGDASAAVFDPDGDPASRTVLRIGRTGFPLEWSPDGRRLLFTRLEGGGVFFLEPDGSVGQITQSTGGFGGASWSPDGSRIVYASAEGPVTALYVIEADASITRLLVSTSDERFLYPSWSPNGSLIAFLRAPAGGPADPASCDDACQHEADLGTSIWVVGADGSDPRPLLPGWSLEDRIRAWSYNAPAWSPDGTHLAFAAYENEGPSDVQLFVVDLFARDPVLLTSGHGDALAPAWSPDGSRIAFVRKAGRRHELTLIDANGSNERSLIFLVPPLFEGSPVLWDELPSP